MPSQTILYIMLAIFVLDFLFERFLEILNNKNIKTEIPERLKDVFDAEKYKKQQEYRKETSNFELITSLVSFSLLLIMLIWGGFGWLDSIIGQYTQNMIIRALLFFGFIGAASGLINLPFSWYGTFVIEEKYGFNKTKPLTFMLDKLKGMLLAVVMGGGIMAAIIAIYQASGSMFWIYAWCVVSGFSIFMAMFYSSIIVPLFNKQTPLGEGDLRSAIELYASKVGFKLKNVYVIDGSKRSTKANAYFTGLGKTKRVVLYDTLINDLTTEEIVAVLAHEIGHYKHKHINTSILIGVLQTGILFYILSLFISIPELSQALGATHASFHIGLIAFGILFTPVSFVLGILTNVLSRKNEYQADQYAKTTFNAEALISGLKKLTSNNLGNLTPHPLYVFFHYSHPSLLQRMIALEKK